MPAPVPPVPFPQTLFREPEFTAAESGKIAAGFKRVEFSRHALLLRAGAVAGCYWFVERGFLRAYAVNPKGADITTHFYAPGDPVIDWPSFFLRVPARQNIEALSDCVCWRLDHAVFQEFFHASAAFREAGRARLVKSYFDLEQHRVSLIADSARDRYQRLVRERPVVAANAPLKHIASFLGVTAPSLSRIRRRLARTRPTPA